VIAGDGFASNSEKSDDVTLVIIKIVQGGFTP
jgi:hypothetical protein